MTKEIVYTETNKMHFDNENLLGAKCKKGGTISFNEEVFHKVHYLDTMFCTGLKDIFGLEKTNWLLAAEPLTHTFSLDDNGKYICTFAEESLAYIIEHSTEEETRQVKTLHEACKITHLWQICEMLKKIV